MKETTSMIPEKDEKEKAATVGETGYTGDERAQRMQAVLEAALSPSLLVIRDESARHRHHMGVRAALRGPKAVGQTHYAIEIVSAAFDDLPPLARHRLVNDLLASEFEQGLHALSLTLRREGALKGKRDS